MALLILDSLRGHKRDHPSTGLHPGTGQWATDYGRAVTGSTCAEQLATAPAR